MRKKKTLADNLKKLLKEQHMSQRELALRIGTSEASISRYLHGARIPNIEILYNLAKALGTTMDDMIDGVDWRRK